MSTFEVVLAIVLGGVVRGVLVGGLVTAISALLAGLPLHHAVAALYFVVVVATIFACAGFLSALWAQDFDRLSMFQNYALTPLTYLGGVFFAVEMLPPFWQKVALGNPILYFVNGLRFGFLNVSDVHVALAGAIALAVAVALFCLCWRLVHVGYNIKT
jgi:ABC-2 type transport system permease protein